MKCTACLALGLVLALTGSGRVMADWQDWWRTPEQRAAQAYEQGEHERLLQEAPDAGWTGLGHYQSGDFDAASRAFAERAGELQQQGDIDAANRALYNQGVSDVRAGRYEEAIEEFEAVLQSDPAFTDAALNRDIAEQLQALQQQQEQPPQQGDEGEPGEGEQEGEGEPGDQGESGDQDASGEQDQADDSQSSTDSGEQSGQESGENPSGEQSEGDSGESSTQDPESSGSQGDEQVEAATDAEREAAAQAAQRALDAEAQQVEDDASDEAAGADAAVMNERPLSETEQATEQLLRRIPDDPAGLLRRRLEQSHRIEYPEVRDGREAW